jgi:hypothetical protein
MIFGVGSTELLHPDLHTFGIGGEADLIEISNEVIEVVLQCGN